MNVRAFSVGVRACGVNAQGLNETLRTFFGNARARSVNVRAFSANVRSLNTSPRVFFFYECETILCARGSVKPYLCPYESIGFKCELMIVNLRVFYVNVKAFGVKVLKLLN